MSGRLLSGLLAHGATHMVHTVAVSTGTSSGRVRYQVSRFSAQVVSAGVRGGVPVVRYAIYGFGLGPAQPGDPAHDPRPVHVYLHYLDPSGLAAGVVEVADLRGVRDAVPPGR